MGCLWLTVARRDLSAGALLALDDDCPDRFPSGLVRACWSKQGLEHSGESENQGSGSGARLIVAGAGDLARTRAELLAENALLRQHVIVLQRSIERPRLHRDDRLLLLVLARLTRRWRDALHVVSPETLLRWRRDLFKVLWRRKSRPRGHPKRRPPEIVMLIQVRPPGKRGQTWNTFVRNHNRDIRACDFLQLYDVLSRPIFAFHATREVVHFNVTRNPTDAWAAQQLREATPTGDGPTYLIRDNDEKFGKWFDSVAERTGIEMLKIAPRSPDLNPICERFLGSLRRECLDHVVILNERRLRRGLKEYIAIYLNGARSHHGLRQARPVAGARSVPKVGGKIVPIRILGGLHHDYQWAA